MNSIDVAPDLQLPASAVTQTFGFFGKKGSGKTYAAGKLAECLMLAGAQIVVLDPVGNWYGLRLDRSGKRASPFTLPIIGGEQGDVPLEASAGSVIADFIVETGSSAVLDVSPLRKGQRKEFVADFAEQLFHRKKTSRSPLHLFVEEAQVFAPAYTGKSDGSQRMLGAMEDIVRIGRNYGIGASMISQRPQSVNTELRNQCEVLAVFQLVAKHERDAIAGWMQHQGVDADLAELARLKTGDCFFWSPSWLELFVRTRFGRKETFDSSATPEAGSQAKQTRLKPVDLGALTTAMEAAIETAKANDPKLLQAKIRELEKQLSRQRFQLSEQDLNEAVAEAVADRDAFWIDQRHAAIKAVEAALSATQDTLYQQLGLEVKPPAVKPAIRPAAKSTPVLVGFEPGTLQTRPSGIDVDSFGSIPGGKAERRILAALYWLRHEEATPAKVSFYSDYSSKSSSFANALGKLRSAGLVSGWRITNAGEAEIGSSAGEKPSGQELLAWLQNKLGRAERSILQACVDAYPSRLSSQEIADASGYSATSSSFANALGKLRSVEAVEGYVQQGGTKASDVFFNS